MKRPIALVMVWMVGLSYVPGLGQSAWAVTAEPMGVQGPPDDSSRSRELLEIWTCWWPR